MGFNFDFDLGEILETGLKEGISVGGAIAKDKLGIGVSSPAPETKPVERQIATTATTQVPAGDPVKPNLGGTDTTGVMSSQMTVLFGVVIVGVVLIAGIGAALGIKALVK